MSSTGRLQSLQVRDGGFVIRREDLSLAEQPALEGLEFHSLHGGAAFRGHGRSDARSVAHQHILRLEAV